jgi:hypothetical protein
LGARSQQEVIVDEKRFEGWLRALGEGSSRRGVLAALGGLGLAALPGASGAKRRRRKTRARGVATAKAPEVNGQGRYQTLAAKWWAWAIGEDFAPVAATGNVDCGVGQRGNTWFLAGGIFPPPATISRTCSIPKGKHLFFPVINVFAAAPPAQTACTLVPEPTTRQLQEHQQCVAAFIDQNVDPSTLTAEVDGKAVPIVRARSALYPIHLDDDNVFGAPPGTYLEAADGYWVLLDPLPAGNHVIAFSAEFADDPVLDVTYNLTIA